MNTVSELYEAVRACFPEITEKADREHIRLWGDLDPELSYSWFESLATARNREMQKGISFGVHERLFAFVCKELAGGSKEIRNCIDVAFVENLFWQVPSGKAEPYWQELPGALKALYLDFHRRTP